MRLIFRIDFQFHLFNCECCSENWISTIQIYLRFNEITEIEVRIRTSSKIWIPQHFGALCHEICHSNSVFLKMQMELQCLLGVPAANNGPKKFSCFCTNYCTNTSTIRLFEVPFDLAKHKCGTPRMPKHRKEHEFYEKLDTHSTIIHRIDAKNTKATPLKIHLTDHTNEQNGMQFRINRVE